MNWQEAAEALWGDEWIAPLSEVLGINRRTIERWKAGDGGPLADIETDLVRIASRQGPRAVGAVLRRLARGESLDEIEADFAEHQRAVRRVREDRGKYPTIEIFGPGPK